jgi:hypothetical protein
MKLIKISVILLLSMTMISSMKKDQSQLIPYNPLDYNLYKNVADQANTELINFLNQIMKNIQIVRKKAWCLVAPPKSEESLTRKVQLELDDVDGVKGQKDFEQIKDFVRSSIIFQNLDDLNAVKAKLDSKFGAPIKYKNNFENLNDSGSRDINLVYQFSKHTIKRNKNLKANQGMSEEYGLKFEVQLHICNIFVVKESVHGLYEVQRVVEKINSNLKWSKVLEISDVSEKSFEIFVNNINSQIKPYAKKHLDDWEKAYNNWSNDKDNVIKAKNLVNACIALEKKIFDEAYKDYDFRIKQGLLPTCFLDKVIDNNICSFKNPNGYNDFKSQSTSYIKDLLKYLSVK